MNLIIAAILSLTVVRGPHNGEDLDRSVAVAKDIAEAVEAAKVLPVKGDAAKEGTALALVAIAWHESGFRADIQDCRACDGKSLLCDHGKSLTMYQMKKHAWQGHTRAEVCADNVLATSLALGVLSRHHTTMDGVFRAYATGGAQIPSRAGAELNAIFERLTRKFKFKLVAKGSGTEVMFTPASKVMLESSALTERLRYIHEETTMKNLHSSYDHGDNQGSYGKQCADHGMAHGLLKGPAMTKVKSMTGPQAMKVNRAAPASGGMTSSKGSASAIAKGMRGMKTPNTITKPRASMVMNTDLLG